MSDPDRTQPLKLVEMDASGNGASYPSLLSMDRSAARRERSTIIGDMLVDREFFPLWDKQILEIDCGRGEMLHSMLEMGASEENLYGVERIPRRVDDLRRRYPLAHLFCESIEELAFHDARFDLVVCSRTFSAIPDVANADRLVREIRRILQPGGAVVWYDARYELRRGKRAYGIRQLRRLFGGCDVSVRTCTLLPSIEGRLGRFSDVLYPVLALVSPLRSHYAGLIIPI